MRGLVLNNSEIAHLGMTLWPGGEAVSAVDPVSAPVAADALRNVTNPISGAGVIRYSVPRADRVCLEIFNVHGRRVSSLEDRSRPAGEYETRWDASGLPGGVYFARLAVGREVSIRKLTVTH